MEFDTWLAELPSPSPATLTAVQEALSRRFGVGVRRVVVRRGLVQVETKAGLRFTLLPGGSLEVGLRRADEVAFAARHDWTAGVTIGMEAMRQRGARRAELRPWLCAQKLLPVDAGGELETSFEEAQRLAEVHGARLMTEAEAEWVLRGFSANRSFTVARTPGITHPTLPH